jgi:CubicO group peptidase (beta-lactamase class C family)
MRRSAVVPLVLALYLLPPHATQAQAPEAPPGDGRARQVDSLGAAYTGSGSPGLAVAVVQEGRVLMTRGYGLADLEHRVPVTPATVFDAASVAKQFTGLAVATLVVQGRLRLGDDVRRYLPELPDVRARYGRPITVADLVHHTSGLRDWPGTLAAAGWDLDDVISREQILDMAARQRTLNFAPGAEHEYSNTGYVLLAEVVARVTGRPFAAWMEEQVFRPLGMGRTRVRSDRREVIADRAYGYVRGDTGYRVVPDNLTAPGSSSLFTTAADLARWLANFDARVAGGDSALALARTPGALASGVRVPYAFGLALGEHGGLPTVNHDGGWAGFGAYVVHFPRQRLGVAVLSNGAADAEQAAYAVADVFLGATPSRPGPVATAPANTPVGAQGGAPVEVPPATLDAYAGLYKYRPGLYVRVRRAGGGLTAHATGEPEYPAVTRSPTEFWVAPYRSALVFPAAPGGAPTPHVVQRGRVLPRVPEPATGGWTPGPLAAYAGEYVSDELQRPSASRRAGGDSALVLRHPRTARSGSPARTGRLRRLHLFVLSVEFQRGRRGAGHRLRARRQRAEPGHPLLQTPDLTPQ